MPVLLYMSNVYFMVVYEYTCVPVHVCLCTYFMCVLSGLVLLPSYTACASMCVCFFPSSPSYSHVYSVIRMDIFSCFSLHSLESLLNFQDKNRFLCSFCFTLFPIFIHRMIFCSFCSHHNLSVSCVYFEFSVKYAYVHVYCV